MPADTPVTRAALGHPRSTHVASADCTANQYSTPGRRVIADMVASLTPVVVFAV